MTSETRTPTRGATLAPTFIRSHPLARAARTPPLTVFLTQAAACTRQRLDSAPAGARLEASVAKTEGKRMLLLAGPGLGAAVHLSCLCRALPDGPASF